MEVPTLSEEILESIVGNTGIAYQMILLLLAYLASLYFSITLVEFSPIILAHLILLGTSMVARFGARSREAKSFFAGLLLILLIGMVLIYLSVFLPRMGVVG